MPDPNCLEWHPAKQVSDAWKQAKQTMPDAPAPAPAPRPRRRRPRILAIPRTEAEQTLTDYLNRTPCPADPRLSHLIPPISTECVRGCGTDITRMGTA